MRKAHRSRCTRETRIVIDVNIDGKGHAEISSEVGFLNHMLETMTMHGRFDIKALIKGDTGVDLHHTVEDAGIVLGEAFALALGACRGINRAGFFIVPMDESLAQVAIDISGRPYVRMDARFRLKKIGDFPCDLVEDFIRGFASALRATIHVKILYGRSDHHKIECIFKALGKALQQACMITSRSHRVIPSRKGTLC